MEVAGGNDTFLTEHPFSVLLSGKQRRIPWIVGFNADEGLHVTASKSIIAVLEFQTVRDCFMFSIFSEISNDKDLTEKVENRWSSYSGEFLIYASARTDITEALRKFYIDAATVPPVVSLATTTSSLPVQPLPAATQSPVPPSLYPALPSLAKLNNASQVPPAPHVQLPLQPLQPTPAAPHYALENFQNQLINLEEKLPQFTRLFTDRLFAAAILKSVQIQSKLAPVFMYYNNYKGQYSFVDVYAGKEKEPVPAMKKVSSWFKTKILGRTVQQPQHLGEF